MKKLFSILAVAMTAISLNATVVTKDFDMSQFSNYGTATVSGGSITDAAKWNGAQSWQWVEGASEYDQVVLEVADHAEKILFRIQYSDLSEVQKELQVGTNSMAIDIEQDIIKGIAVLNWSETSGVDITITGLYMRGATGVRKEVSLWNTGKTFDDWNSWEDRIVLEASLFEDIHSGDILEVNYTPDENDYHQLKIHLDWDGEIALAFLSDAIDEDKQININTTTNPTKMRFPIISETDIANIKAQGGLAVHGKYITVNSFKLIKHELLWSGDQTIGNWDKSIIVEESKLSELEVGDVLCFHINNYTAGGLIYLKYGEWQDFSPKKEYKFADSGSEEKTVEILVTTSMLDQLNDKNLIVQGVQYSINEIYVKKGIGPAATVNKEIEVTSAGMATLVLPFAVPSLPDGVEAYTLTNNGDEDIIATEVHSLNADEPVLIKAPQDNYTFVSEEGASEDISSKTGLYRNGALVGTYYNIADISAISTDANYKYLLQNGTDGVAFYQVLDGSCSVAPYRAYLSCGYDASTPKAGGMPPRKSMRIVFRTDETTGLGDVQRDNVQGVKLIEDGQLYIKYKGTKYNVQGQKVR